MRSCDEIKCNGNHFGYPLRSNYLCVSFTKLKSLERTALESSSLLSNVVPPDPFPNSEVKRVSADNT